MATDSIHDFAAIEVDALMADLRRLALDAADHVLGKGTRPALTADEARRLAPLILQPHFGNAERRRAERLLLQPLRLTRPADPSTSFGPLEMIAAMSALSRLSRLTSAWRKLRRGGVDSGSSILTTITRLAFGDLGFREKLSLLVAARLARDVVLWPRLSLPVAVDDTALLALIALVVPRPERHLPTRLMRRVEAGLVRSARERLSSAPARGFGAWLIAEAAELHLGQSLTPIGERSWWTKISNNVLPVPLREYLRKFGPSQWRVPLFSTIDVMPLVLLAAANPAARPERFPLLASHHIGPLDTDSLDDGITPFALRSYLIRQF